MSRDHPGNGPVPRLHRIEDGCLVLFVALLVLLACGQILLRNAANITLVWSEPLIRHLVLWIGLLGALIATREARHIHIDAGLRLLSPGTREIAAAIGDIVAGSICCLLTPAALRFVQDERLYGGDVIDGVPRWILQLVFPLAFGGMGLRFLQRALGRARRLVRQRQHQC